ncbi:hypothetical protein [Listeria fleischmannii]|uniref:Gp8 n=1 Tax=Listeria fleischmannii FSL S10-1203 TaxID=1265822 RepID=W7DGI1_9LIST|nr:hypothetical protein [Listeria fleischmannii]EUJ59552.1 gp8 [Listeria fleischmannii FSL S10-1203]
MKPERGFFFFGFAEVYNPSSKDIEILNNKGIDVTKSLTVRIRDTGGEYLPSNKHYFEVDDVYFSGEVYQIQSISLDSEMHNYMKVIGTLTV